MGKHDIGRVTEPLEITFGFNADRYTFHATVRGRDAPEGTPPILAVGMQSMEIVTVDELAAELKPWIVLNGGHRDYLEGDRKLELYKADREYRQEQALQREENGPER